MSFPVSDIAFSFGSSQIDSPSGSQTTYPLPPGYLPYPEFKAKFSLGTASTEQSNPNTINLSTTMLRNRADGLLMLLKEETRVIAGFETFAPGLDKLAAPLAERARAGGRVIFVGVGSSGRAGLDIAAEAMALCPTVNALGLLGGGDCALIQAREGFEDSPQQGALAAQQLNLTAHDSIFLISASGSASFNAGFGDAAANLGAHVFYFYNSVDVPERTSELFIRARNPVVPLLLDIGPQAILGSTRLQGFSIARICLGYLLGQMICHLDPTQDKAAFSAQILSENLQLSLEKIQKVLPELSAIVDADYAVFSSPNANFHRFRDTTAAGYDTRLGTSRSVRELLVDCVETSPTFFVNPRRRESTPQKRRAEYQAYLVDSGLNDASAWTTVLGRLPLSAADQNDMTQFILSTGTPGLESFANRPQAEGNIVIGADILHKGDTLSLELIEQLSSVKTQGGTTALIVISEDPMPNLKEQLAGICDFVSLIDNFRDDPQRLTSHQTLKWQCNLISNGAMIMMGKVIGNRMIDLRTSNNKLIDRCMRIIQEAWTALGMQEQLDEEQLYCHILTVYEQQKTYQDRGEYVPSTSKMVLTMLLKDCSFEEAAHLLGTYGENIDRLYNQGINI